MFVLPLASLTLLLMTAAAVVALSLIRVTQHRLAWQLMAAGIGVTAFRRAYLLIGVLVTEDAQRFDLVPELFSFSIAAFLLAGLTLLHPMLAGMRRAHADERAGDDGFFRLSLNLLCITDMEGRFLRLNPSWGRVLGYSESEILGRRLFDFLHPDDLARTEEELRKLSQGVLTLDFQNRYQAQDGGYRWLRWTAQPDGERQRIYAAVSDITDLHAAQEELLMLRNAVAQSTGLIMITEPRFPDPAIVFVNESCLALTGYRREELVGRDAGVLLGGRMDDVALESIREAVVQERSIEVDLMHYRKDGAPFWGRVTLSPIRDEAGVLRYYLAVIFDVTQHRRMQDDLRRHRDQLDQLVQERTLALNETNAELLQSTERLQEAQRIARMGDWEFDVDTGELHWSDGMYHLYERARPANGVYVETPFESCLPEDRVGLAEAARSCVEQGASVQHEFRAQLPGGRQACHLSVMQPRYDETGRVIRLVGTVQDVTAQREAEQSRQQLEERMRQAQKLESLGMLAGGIAHDFNNLLMGILGNASLLRTDLPADDEVQHSVEQIEKAAQRAAELTSQMLAYAGRGRLLVQPHDLSEIIQQSAGLLESTLAERIALRLELASNLPAVRCDASQLRQVLLSLVTNASEAMEDRVGSVTLRTGVRSFAENELFDIQAPEARPAGDYVFIAVIDEGCGIPEDLHDRVFDPFYTTKFTGRGLGLAATLGIVHGHGGAVQLTSVPGAGASFQLYFPACAAIRSVAVATSTPEADGRPSGVILVVDDEALVRRTAHQILERGGYSVLEARDGHEAVTLFAIHGDSIRAVLLDLTMPGMDGEATLRELMRIRDDVKVLLSSGYSEQDAVPRFDLQKFAPFLQKPYTAQALLHAMHALLTASPVPR
jgi:PAS domain S-box-containing protein